MLVSGLFPRENLVLGKTTAIKGIKEAFEQTYDPSEWQVNGMRKLTYYFKRSLQCLKHRVYSIVEA